MRTLGMVILIPALALVALLPAARSAADDPTLQAYVGPGIEIGLEAPPGPGTYHIHVSDRSEEHNFHLTGPGIDLMTSVEAIEEVDWTVTFAEAQYRYQCDTHSFEMFRDFRVVTLKPPPPPPPPPAPVARCVVPKVVGKPLAAATKSITAGHCLRVGKVTRASSAKVVLGRVISQKPRAGAKLRKGSRVDLVVSRGPKKS